MFLRCFLSQLVNTLTAVLPSETPPCSVPPGRQAVIKVAGLRRSTVAATMLATGGILALCSGVVGTLTMGCGASLLCIAAHATMRKPNLKARLNAAGMSFAGRA